MKTTQKIMMGAIRGYLKTLGPLFPEKTNRALWRLFCTPRRKKFKAVHQRLMQRAIGLEMEVESVPLRGYLWGTGDKRVMLVHGWESHSLDFYLLIERLLAADYQVIAFDLPAHGRSGGKQSHLPLMKRALKAILKQIGTPHALIGHSLGAVCLTRLLADSDVAQKINHFVALAPPPEPPKFLQIFGGAVGASSSQVERLYQEIPRLTGDSIYDYQMYDLYPQVKAERVMLCYDEADEVIPAEDSLRLVQAWEGATILEARNMGHYRMVKDPQLIEQILQFLQSNQAQSHGKETQQAIL